MTFRCVLDNVLLELVHVHQTSFIVKLNYHLEYIHYLLLHSHSLAKAKLKMLIAVEYLLDYYLGKAKHSVNVLQNEYKRV
jgi:hypothetical protein